jgi:hypothetical protein
MVWAWTLREMEGGRTGAGRREAGGRAERKEERRKGRSSLKAYRERRGAGNKRTMYPTMRRLPMASREVDIHNWPLAMWRRKA